MAGDTAWGAKAASLYDRAYAARYRLHDDGLANSAIYHEFVAWLQRVCEKWSAPFDALDLGCGTGRYFCALRGVRTLVGFDASPSMLEQARHPLNEDQISVGDITLVHGDLMTQDFGEGRFDLVYSIGVLAEHAPHRGERGFAGPNQHPNAHGFLLRRHGLYTWGESLGQAKRHLEILEFLLEVLARTHTLSNTVAR